MEMSPARARRPKRVLIADDDVDVCALLARVLVPVCHVTAVHDAEAALAILASSQPFDMIISDFMLPGITGIEFVSRVRSHERSTRTPILMISGHDPSDVGDRARAAGADAFLNKPFTLVQLRRAVDNLLGGARVLFA
jgi:CheY-like chemotaxis protein